MDLAQDWLNDARREFEKYRRMAERALAQVPEPRWFEKLDPEANSVALVMKHMAGNMRSRWTDFLTTDGEKPDRNRDTEFEDAGDDVASIRARWDAGWTCLFAALAPLTPADLARTITIRGEPHTVAQAIQRQLTHYAYHVGQIVLLAKHGRVRLEDAVDRARQVAGVRRREGRHALPRGPGPLIPRAADAAAGRRRREPLTPPREPQES